MLGFIKNRSVLSKTARFHQKPSPLHLFCEFFIASFHVLANRSVLFETCTFVNILRNLNFNQPNDAYLKNFLD
jgi:hypothetical protein